MTDEEILKRLAEIEGWTVGESNSPDAIPYARWRKLDEKTWIYESVNPLRYDEHCMELVKKHCLWISAPLFEGDEWGVSDYGGPEYKDVSLNHAVCFAIIQDAGVK